MVRAKGPDRSILVSDTVALAGMPAGMYTTPVGGRVEMSADGRLSMEGRSTLAGGAIPLVHCIGRAMSMTGLGTCGRPYHRHSEPRTLCRRPRQIAGGRTGGSYSLSLANEVAIQEVWLAGELVVEV
jgi:N-acetylglucosamine-6-phosphate deacetylase